MIGFGIGNLVSGPFSEAFGRNVVYICSLFIFMIWIMASGLAPNIGAQIVFRFLAGFFGSTPLTCAGGTVSDLWNPLEKTFGFPLFAISGFGGPVLGPVIGSYIGTGSIGSWRWSEWIILSLSGAVVTLVFLFQPETHPHLLLRWKAHHLREVMGDNRFVAESEVDSVTLLARIGTALKRPFLMVTEPIVLLMAGYLTVIYIVLFTFLTGYTFIFSDVYGTSQGLTNVLFVGILLGVLLAMCLVPLIYHWTKQEQKRCGGDSFPPEYRLWFAMLGGAPAIPVGLLWMGWTDYVSLHNAESFLISRHSLVFRVLTFPFHSRRSQSLRP